MRVIAPDLLGLGWSDKPRDVPLGIAAQARYVGELLDHLDIDKVAVVGHSAGGGIAQLLAADPGRHVEALVLLDCMAFDEWPTDGVLEVQTLPPEMETPETIEIAIRSAFRLGMIGEHVGDDDLNVYLEPWRASADAPAFFRWARALDGVGLKDLETVMANWTIPTLILWGERDPFFPPGVAERLNAAIPSSALGLVPDCGHFLPEEAPETIDPIIAEYLRTTYLRIPHGHSTGPVLVSLSRADVGSDDEQENDEPVVRADQEVGPNA
jgi:pimeloyl-ACP methyl ester carboxylesterase